MLFAVVLRLAQYLANRSLWLNEASLALNMLHRDALSLARELDFNQGAPIGFLYAEKIAIHGFGASEYSLRLFPLVCSLASIYLFARLSASLLDAALVPLALLLFAASDGLIYYASEAKQYSTDVCAALILTLIAYASFHGEFARTRNSVIAASLGLVVMAFSHATAFVALSIVVVFAGQVVRERNAGRSRRLLPILAIWGTGAVIAAAVSFEPLTHLRSSFPARTEPLSLGYAMHWLNKLVTSLAESLGLLLGPAWASSVSFKLAAVVAFAGLIAAFRRSAAMTSILVLPGLLAYAAFLTDLYPVYARTTLFMLPAGIIILSQGVGVVGRALPRAVALPVAGVCVIMLCALPVSYAVYHLAVPRHHEELRPVLEHIRAAWRPGDAIYVHYAAQYAFLYYLECGCVNLSRPGSDAPLWDPRVGPFGKDEFAPAMRSRPPNFFVGPTGHNFARALGDLQRLRGRVWFVYSHVSDAQENAFLKNRLTKRLDEMGARLEEIHATQAHAYLFDLKTWRVATPSRSPALPRDRVARRSPFFRVPVNARKRSS